MTTAAARPGSGRVAPWMAAPGFLVGLFVIDLWPGLGTWQGVISLPLTVGLFLSSASRPGGPLGLPPAWLLVSWRCSFWHFCRC